MTDGRQPTGPINRLDPRTKLGLQIAFVAAAMAHTTESGLPIIAVIGFGLIVGAGQRIRMLLYELRYLVMILAMAPLLGGITVIPPGFTRAGAWDPLLAAVRVLIVVMVCLAIVRTTKPSELSAATTWFVPGRLGRWLGLSVGLVARFLPLIRREVRQTRQALSIRNAGARPPHERVQFLSVTVLVRLFERADRVRDALLARNLTWNPTPPSMSFSWRDGPGALVIGALFIWALL